MTDDHCVAGAPVQTTTDTPLAVLNGIQPSASVLSLVSHCQPVQTQAWVQPGLSVLVNITQNNTSGCAVVAAGGGTGLAARLVAALAAERLSAGGVHLRFGSYCRLHPNT